VGSAAAGMVDVGMVRAAGLAGMAGMAAVGSVGSAGSAAAGDGGCGNGAWVGGNGT
jgi:hypothetical protein